MFFADFVVRISESFRSRLGLVIANNNCIIRGAFNKFPDFFGMDTFINRTHKKL